MSVCKIKFDLSLREAEGLRELILTYRSISRENLRSVFTPELRKGLIEERIKLCDKILKVLENKYKGEDANIT